LATSTPTIHALTIGGAVSGSGGGGGGAGVGFAGAGSGNKIDNDVFAYASGGLLQTITTGGVSLTAKDESKITADAGGVGVGLLFGGGGGGAGSVGVAARRNDITNNVKAYVDGAKVTSAGTVTLLAKETATIDAFALGGAVAVAAGGGGGVALGAAGADTTNHIGNNVYAYVANSSEDSSKGVTSQGALSLTAIDAPTMTADAGGASLIIAGGGGGGAAVAVGFAISINDVADKVKAYTTDSTLKATAGTVPQCEYG
jgi:hypothetical protein